MNNFLLILFFTLISCKGNSQEEKIQDKMSNLKTSFLNKNEKEFLNNFPKTFDTFNDTFGWDNAKNSPEPLYNNANKYIDYWFFLLQKAEYKNHEAQIISISKNGIWEPDAVNYFRVSAINYIKKESSYNLINVLNYKDAKTVLSFFFNPLHSKFDSIFVSGLDKEKQQIVKKIISKNISKDKERSTLSYYENNKEYFTKTFDVNKDGILDRIVSNKAYQEETDLFVFYGNLKGEYRLVLETTNFSQDGGNIIESIYPITSGKGFMIKTFFPDKGYYEKEYYIIPQKNIWTLRNIVYKTISDTSENSVNYICDVIQNIDITKSGWSEKISEIPDEIERSKKCYTENTNFQKSYSINDPDGYTNLRKEKKTSSEILEKIKSGENVDVIDKSTDWYLVKTNKGNQGYVHKSRVK